MSLSCKGAVVLWAADGPLGFRLLRPHIRLIRGARRGGLARALGRGGLSGGWREFRQRTHQAGLPTGRIVGVEDAFLGRLVERADGPADLFAREAGRVRQRGAPRAGDQGLDRRACGAVPVALAYGGAHALFCRLGIRHASGDYTREGTTTMAPNV